METKHNFVPAISAALNGCAYCLADHREFWAKKKSTGVAYPIASVCDETDENLPWYHVLLVDYLGERHDIADFCEESQEELFGILVNELY